MIRTGTIKAKYLVVPRAGRHMLEHSDEKKIERSIFGYARGSGRSSISIQQQMNYLRMLTNAASWDVNLQLKHDAEQAAQQRKFLGGR